MKTTRRKPSRARAAVPGRREPYTERGVRRLRCIRYPICGNKAHASWNICADDGLHRPLCKACDDELNEMVLRWAGFGDWREKMERYRSRV